MTKRGNACVWSVIYVCAAEWMRSPAQCTCVLCFTVPPMFAVPIKQPSEGLSFEQEAAPSPRDWELSQEGSQLCHGFYFLCVVDTEVSSVRLVFARKCLCLPQQASIRSPILQMGKIEDQEGNYFFSSPQEHKKVSNFNTTLRVPLYNFVGGIRAGEHEEGNMSLRSDSCIQSEGWNSLPLSPFPKPFLTLLSHPDSWPAGPLALLLYETQDQVPSMTYFGAGHRDP